MVEERFLNQLNVPATCYHYTAGSTKYAIKQSTRDPMLAHQIERLFLPAATASRRSSNGLS